MDTKVLIGMPCGSGTMPSQMVTSLLTLRKQPGTAFLIIDRQRTDKARNSLALEALKQGCTHLLFVDDDNPIPDDTLEKFLEDDKDIVIAPILGRNPDANGNFNLCAFYKREVETSQGVLRLYDNIQLFRDEGPLHRIDAGGTGCMLIKRKVLEAMASKFGDELFAFGEIKLDPPMVVNGKEYKKRTMSEDVEFCERAVDLGFEVWLDDRVRPIHLGSARSLRWSP
jgi:GT2 family glycosyltransferase